MRQIWTIERGRDEPDAASRPVVQRPSSDPRHGLLTGRRIAYSATTRSNGSTSPCSDVMNADGTGRTWSRSPHRSSWASWSPDGQRLAFVTRRIDKRRLSWLPAVHGGRACRGRCGRFEQAGRSPGRFPCRTRSCIWTASPHRVVTERRRDRFRRRHRRIEHPLRNQHSGRLQDLAGAANRLVATTPRGSLVTRARASWRSCAVTTTALNEQYLYTMNRRRDRAHRS